MRKGFCQVVYKYQIFWTFFYRFSERFITLCVKCCLTFILEHLNIPLTFSIELLKSLLYGTFMTFMKRHWGRFELHTLSIFSVTFCGHHLHSPKIRDLQWFPAIRKVIVFSRRSVIVAEAMCRSSGDVCFLISVCLLVLVYVCVFQITELKILLIVWGRWLRWWRDAVPGSPRKQEREYFLDTGPRFLDFCLQLLLLFVKSESLWNDFEEKTNNEKNAKHSEQTEWLQGFVGDTHTHARRHFREYVGYILVPWVKVTAEYAENNQRTMLQQKNGNS